ncbi:MAG: hypothetical protein ABFS45_15455 [Pseudomonadota bacterium]
MRLLKTYSNPMLIFILMGILCGCSSMQERKQLDALGERTRAYGKMLRWGQYEDAASMRRAREGEELKSIDTDHFKEIRVTSYRVTRSELTEDRKEATVSASIDFYHERQNRLTTLHDQQSWWYDEQRKKWYLEDDLPAFFKVP